MGISSMFISNTNQQVKMIRDYFCTKRRFHEMEDFNSTNEIGLYSMYNGTSHIIINVWSLKPLFSVTLMIISNILNYTTTIAQDKICINTILAPGLKAHKLFIGALCPYQGHTLQSMANNTGTSDRKHPIIQEQELPSKKEVAQSTAWKLTHLVQTILTPGITCNQQPLHQWVSARKM